MDRISVKANAKINLFLDVVGKMDDGFHEIRSVMHSISLCDSVSVERFSSSEGRISIYVKGKYFLPCNNKNLAYRAAELFFEALQEKLSIRIGIQKRIPVAAGLLTLQTDELRRQLQEKGRLYHTVPLTLGLMAALALF